MRFRQQQQEEDAVLHEAHIREVAHDEAEDRAEGRPLEHADRGGRGGEDERADAERPDMAEHHVLEHQRQQHEQGVAQQPGQIQFFEDIVQSPIPPP